jgi:hypothetical protein
VQVAEIAGVTAIAATEGLRSALDYNHLRATATRSDGCAKGRVATPYDQDIESVG